MSDLSFSFLDYDINIHTDIYKYIVYIDIARLKGGRTTENHAIKLIPKSSLIERKVLNCYWS